MNENELDTQEINYLNSINEIRNRGLAIFERDAKPQLSDGILTLPRPSLLCGDCDSEATPQDAWPILGCLAMMDDGGHITMIDQDGRAFLAICCKGYQPIAIYGLSAND